MVLAFKSERECKLMKWLIGLTGIILLLVLIGAFVIAFKLKKCLNGVDDESK